MEPASPRTSAAIGRHVSGLDGMRAVGMSAVMLFHAQLGAKGAFLALSQFFTLSGFLIVALLIRRLEAENRVDLVAFWGRRYRRLMPASIVTLAGILVFGATLATEQQVDAIRRGVLASLAQVVNWQFIFTDVSYVDQFQSPSPIQHFWSLAVEEQFYLVVPVLMVVVFKVTRSMRAVTAVFATLAAASSGLMFTLFERGSSIDRLYYGTDTRASEMLIGGLLALLLHQFPPRLGRRARIATGWAGVGAYALSTWAFFSLSLTDGRMYRGGLLAFSILTCIVIFSLVAGDGPLARVVGWRPIAATGRITYGIYLIHWPLILALSEERVGIGGWPLFLVVQVPIIVALAALSARFFERPIRYSRASPGDFRFPLAVAFGLTMLAGAALMLSWRDVETDLAGLGESTSDAPVVEDGPLVVAVIADEPGLEFAASLPLDVAATLPFRSDWDADWAGLIAETNPDVILLHVSEWDQPDLSDDPETVLSALRSGFDVLAQNGATIAWGTGPVDFASAARAENDPFHAAMAELSRTRRDVRRLGPADDAEKVALDLELYRRRSTSDERRLLIVGDSVSRTAGYGLERWGTDTGAAVVWSAGTEGCGIARGGLVSDLAGRAVEAPTECDAVSAGWAEQIRTFDPDVVLVISAVADFQERRFPNWPEMLEPGDVLFDDYLVEQYIEAFDILSLGGAEVVWANPPCSLDIFGRFDEPDGGSAVDLDRILHVNNDILPRVITARPALTTFDLYEVFCPNGVMLVEVEGAGVLRPDGAHLSAESSLWFAEQYGEEILGLS